tara:strand:- start:579 stop:755 length:177 start_codon:yes stop_codon:yes gene_type:complete
MREPLIIMLLRSALILTIAIVATLLMMMVSGIPINFVSFAIVGGVMIPILTFGSFVRR